MAWYTAVFAHLRMSSWLASCLPNKATPMLAVHGSSTVVSTFPPCRILSAVKTRARSRNHVRLTPARNRQFRQFFNRSDWVCGRRRSSAPLKGKHKMFLRLPAISKDSEPCGFAPDPNLIRRDAFGLRRPFLARAFRMKLPYYR